MALAGSSTQKAHMSTQQPEALRLAELLTADEWPAHMTLVSYARECVAELRRLHAEVERLRKLVPDIELAREAIYAKAEGREA